MTTKHGCFYSFAGVLPNSWKSYIVKLSSYMVSDITAYQGNFAIQGSRKAGCNTVTRFTVYVFVQILEEGVLDLENSPCSW